MYVSRPKKAGPRGRAGGARGAMVSVAEAFVVAVQMDAWMPFPTSESSFLHYVRSIYLYYRGLALSRRVCILLVDACCKILTR